MSERSARDFIYNHSNATEQDIITLESIANALNTDLGTDQTLDTLWNDVTAKVNQGEKQKAWLSYGTDTVMEQWGAETSSKLWEAAEGLEMPDETKLGLLNAADKIIGKILGLEENITGLEDII